MATRSWLRRRSRAQYRRRRGAQPDFGPTSVIRLDVVSAGLVLLTSGGTYDHALYLVRRHSRRAVGLTVLVVILGARRRGSGASFLWSISHCEEGRSIARVAHEHDEVVRVGSDEAWDVQVLDAVSKQEACGS